MTTAPFQIVATDIEPDSTGGASYTDIAIHSIAVWKAMEQGWTPVGFQAYQGRLMTPMVRTAHGVKR